MAKRKDFVTEGLVTMRHKYVAEELNSLKGDDDVSAAYSTPDVDKNLSVQEQQLQVYHQIRDDLDIRLHKELARLETQIDLEKQDLKKCEAAYDRFGKLLERFTEIPRITELEETSSTLTELEQLRVEFFSIKAACKCRREVSPVCNTATANSPQISLLPELNSLTQLQMLKMGLCFALPLIAGIIIGCIIIAWVIILIFGKQL